MKDLQDIIKILLRNKAALEERFKIKELGIFGSYIKEEQSEESDLDILVDFQEVPTLFSFVELQNTLSDLLTIEVDLVMKSALKKHIGERILREVVEV
jgi:hypothetical protein